MNYKEIDRKFILDYLASQGGECSVCDIINNSGANKLRVYPILFEEIQARKLKVVEEENFGSPKVVKFFSHE